MIYLSICIPTYKRIEITRNTIKSIYADLNGVNLCDFEVVVSDNDENESSKIFVEEFPYPNFHYYKTECEGFMNSFYVLGYGGGAFLKLHNNYTMLKSGTLRYMINEVKQYGESHALMFFTNGLRHFNKKQEFESFDSFMNHLSYFSSWSSGFGIWKDDYNMVKQNIEINKWFPQTSMLLPFNSKSKYILNDEVIFEDQKVPKKGGYNPYRVFGVDYLSLVKDSLDKGDISKETFGIIKDDLLCNYLASRYFKTVIARMDNFEHDNVKKHLSVYYSSFAFVELLLFSILSPLNYFKFRIKSTLIKKDYGN